MKASIKPTEINLHQKSRVLEIAWKAQLRLNRRYARLSAKTKPAGKVITAVARELVGFIWSVATTAETTFSAANAA